MIKQVMVLALAATVLTTGVALADRRDEGRHEHLDARHGHNQSYLDRGVVVRGVPRQAVAVPFGRERYWFHGGVWYRPRGAGFVVVAPPIGIIVPVLPALYVSLLIGGLTYYYANDTYYLWRDSIRGYEVVAPPPGAEAAAVTGAAPPGPGSPPAGTDSVFVYPKNGQPPEQQAKDRYECHRWAADQTGFDPTGGNTSVPPELAAAKRSDYSRAMNACLDARGYSVR